MVSLNIIFNKEKTLSQTFREKYYRTKCLLASESYRTFFVDCRTMSVSDRYIEPIFFALAILVVKQQQVVSLWDSSKAAC